MRLASDGSSAFWLRYGTGSSRRAGHSLPVGRVRDTLRYGRVLLETEGFDLIDAGSWPTRVDDFEGFMHDCARLLRFGGRMKLRVPHDLSVGAWERSARSTSPTPGSARGCST